MSIYVSIYVGHRQHPAPGHDTRVRRRPQAEVQPVRRPPHRHDRGRARILLVPALVPDRALYALATLNVRQHTAQPRRHLRALHHEG